MISIEDLCVECAAMLCDDCGGCHTENCDSRELCEDD